MSNYIDVVFPSIDEEFDFFYVNNYDVGDVVSVAIDNEWSELNPVFDIVLARITNIESHGASTRVGLQLVLSNETLDLYIGDGDPFIILASDFLNEDEFQPAKKQRKASAADKLAQQEAYYDYEIAALALSQNFLKTRCKAYKRNSQSL
jgi:hypothetical protein